MHLKQLLISTTSFALLMIALSVTAAPISGQGTWESILQGRDFDGDVTNGFEAFYDTALDITWLSDAGGLNTTSDWNTAKEWASNLTIGGVSNWRLPSYLGTPLAVYNFQGGSNAGYKPDPTTSELAHLYYITLGNIGYPTNGFGVTNSANFLNVASNYYWLNEPYVTSSNQAWTFSLIGGNQGTDRKILPFNAWAVHSGDVGRVVAVPEPSTYAMLFVGLGLLGFAAKRRNVYA